MPHPRNAPVLHIVTIGDMPNSVADHMGVHRFALAMHEKMAYSRDVKGRGGWQCPEEVRLATLRKMLAEHVAKGDMVDVANLAMMIWNRTHPRG